MQNRRIQHFSVIFLLYGKLKLEVGRKEAPTLQFLTMKDKDPKDISDLLSDLKIKDNENNLGKYMIKELDIKIVYIDRVQENLVTYDTHPSCM